MSQTNPPVVSQHWRQTIGLFAGPAAALLVWVIPWPGLSSQAHALSSIVTLVVIFWLTEAIPLPATALLGVSLAVVCGVAPASKALIAFGDPVIFLFIGSFMLAKAMQVHGVDLRIAYTLLAHPWVGGSTYRTIWALGLTACLLAMWMSNTACVAMLFPVALAIARATAEQSRVPCTRYTTGLLLMLAYAGSVGGIATPVGTPPNLIGMALIEQGLGVRIRFLQWMAFGVPLALVLFVLLYGVIMLLFRPELRTVAGQRQRMVEAKRALGPLSAGERNSLIAFALAVILWVGPGLLGLVRTDTDPFVRMMTERLPEGIVALLAALLLFLLPTHWRRREFTLRWEDAVRIDWGTIVLFGGGIALGRMMFETDLSEMLGKGLLIALGVQGSVTLTGAATGMAILTSETSSNTASANMVVPVMLSMAKVLAVPGAAVGVAATLGASMGFMLPISTPPNAIVYGSKAIRIMDMVKAGLVLDIIGFFVIWGASVWLVPMALALP